MFSKILIQNSDGYDFQERDSVMLGHHQMLAQISPHHDYYDSKSSCETPPSYNQLNYKENIQRFFESKPKTTFSDENNSECHQNFRHLVSSTDLADTNKTLLAQQVHNYTRNNHQNQ